MKGRWVMGVMQRSILQVVETELEVVEEVVEEEEVEEEEVEKITRVWTGS